MRDISSWCGSSTLAPNISAAVPLGLPETGAGASRDSLTLIAGLATVLATAGLALGASGHALSKRPAA